jgi:hypothetical protein
VGRAAGLAVAQSIGGILMSSQSSESPEQHSEGVRGKPSKITAGPFVLDPGVKRAELHG